MLVVGFVFIFRVLQSVRNMRPRTHAQLFDNQFQRHRPLRQQPLRAPTLARRANFASVRQACPVLRSGGGA